MNLTESWNDARDNPVQMSRTTNCCHCRIKKVNLCEDITFLRCLKHFLSNYTITIAKTLIVCLSNSDNRTGLQNFIFLSQFFLSFFFFCKYQQSIINDLYQRLNIKAVQLTLEETQRPLSLTPDSYCCGPVSTTWSRTRDTLLPCPLKQHYITGGFNPQSDVSLVLTYSCTTSPECLDFCLNIVEET